MADTDTTQQVTSKAPVTSVKNPKRVAAGKAIAEKRRLAKEAQKQKMAEADIIIANERLKKAQEEAKKVDQSPPSATSETTLPPDKETVSQTLTTTQLLSVIAIGVSMVGVYYNRQALKNYFTRLRLLFQLRRLQRQLPHQLTHQLTHQLMHHCLLIKLQKS